MQVLTHQLMQQHWDPGWYLESLGLLPIPETLILDPSPHRHMLEHMGGPEARWVLLECCTLSAHTYFSFYLSDNLRMPHSNLSPSYLQLCSSTELAVDCRRKWAVNKCLSYTDGVCHMPTFSSCVVLKSYVTWKKLNSPMPLWIYLFVRALIMLPLRQGKIVSPQNLSPSFGCKVHR